MGSEGGVERSVITRVGTAWRKFRELLSLLTSRVLSLQVRGRLYKACVRSAGIFSSILTSDRFCKKIEFPKPYHPPWLGGEENF